MELDLKKIEELVLSSLEEKLPHTVYQLWFSDLTLIELSEEHMEFSIPDEFKCTILNKRYIEVLKSTVKDIIGFDIKVQISAGDLEEECREKENDPRAPTPEDDEAMEIGMKIEGQSIVEEYTFENFIVGESNKFAHAACYAVAKGADSNEQAPYNPLFIYGPSGLGKTHLLFAITNEIKMSRPSVRIIYKKGEEFTNEMIACLKSGDMQQFRFKYRTADVLLIDDIQFIAGKNAIQEEFFYTFNALYENKKQIILTSDRPPKEINPLEERLCTRFEWGLIADIQPPSEELRTAIIRQKADSLGITIPNDALAFLTNSLQKNIRQIEGAIKKIHAISRLASTPITLDLCRRAIADIVSGVEPAPVTVDRIFKVVAENYGVSVEDIKGQKRNAAIAMARHVSIYLIRQNTNMSLEDIGRKFERDHSTVISSLRRIEEEKKSNPATAAILEELSGKIKVNQ